MDWIIQRSQELKYNNKQFLEKVIRAFSLLEALVDNGAPIIFQGRQLAPSDPERQPQ